MLENCNIVTSETQISIRTIKSKNSTRKYKFIKLGPRNYKELQKVNWEKVNGPIPKGMILRCNGDDTLNCDPSNWRLITSAESLKLNSNREKQAKSHRENKILLSGYTTDTMAILHLPPKERIKKLRLYALKIQECIKIAEERILSAVAARLLRKSKYR